MGGYLLGLWGFSNEVIAAVAFHHTPREAGTNQLTDAGILHGANQIAYELSSDEEQANRCFFDETYFKETGTDNRLDLWRKKSLNIMKTGSETL